MSHDDDGKTDSALQDYTKAIQLKLNYAEAYNNRALLYETKGLHDKALADYTKAIQLDPDYSKAIENRKMLFKSMRR